ncbi:hypothetical protein RhiJN_24279 [Ceratobasidium sp. AG-Ba]|nr:hypothetical protein RhiJN_24279 [Ceratobasidium sp. AG-Ba]
MSPRYLHRGYPGYSLPPPSLPASPEEVGKRNSHDKIPRRRVPAGYPGIEMSCENFAGFRRLHPESEGQGPLPALAPATAARMPEYRRNPAFCMILAAAGFPHIVPSHPLLQ